MGDGGSSEATVEFLVEPFVEGEPGNHVHAAIAAVEATGLAVDVGPFASTTSGEIGAIADAVRTMVTDAFDAGASAVTVKIGRDSDEAALHSLHDALATMMAAAETEIGGDPDSWTRADKQRVVRLLDERGAFLLRGAVDDIATAMGVSRITIYNYLNAIEDHG